MSIELANTRLDETNKVLLKRLLEAQDENKQHKKEISELKMRCHNEASSGVGKIWVARGASRRKEKNSVRVLKGKIVRSIRSYFSKI